MTKDEELALLRKAYHVIVTKEDMESKAEKKKSLDTSKIAFLFAVLTWAILMIIFAMMLHKYELDPTPISIIIWLAPLSSYGIVQLILKIYILFINNHQTQIINDYLNENKMYLDFLDPNFWNTQDIINLHNTIVIGKAKNLAESIKYLQEQKAYIKLKYESLKSQVNQRQGNNYETT